MPTTDGQVNGHAPVNGHESGKVNGRAPAPVPTPPVPAPPAVDASPAAVDAPERAAAERPHVDEPEETGERPGVDEPKATGERPDGTLPSTGEPAEAQEAVDVREAAVDEGETADAPAAAQSGPPEPPTRAAEVPRIPAPAAPPDPGHRPLTAVPHPRTDEPVVPGPATRAPRHATGGRSLRRRVPQTHLAPELRLGATGLADTATPPAADAAASALSRYQASRRAAQTVVGASPAHPDGEGARA
jgi:hypothetical protein